MRELGFGYSPRGGSAGAFYPNAALVAFLGHKKRLVFDLVSQP